MSNFKKNSATCRNLFYLSIFILFLFGQSSQAGFLDKLKEKSGDALQAIKNTRGIVENARAVLGDRDKEKNKETDSNLYADEGSTLESTRVDTLSSQEWAEYQSLLNTLGFAAGPVDGVPGGKTRNAVQEFGLAYGVSEADLFEKEGLQAIRAVANETDGVRPVEPKAESSAGIFQPQLAPTGSGLPDGLAYLDGGILVVKNNLVRSRLAIESHVALLKLEQALVLSADRKLALDARNAIQLADLFEVISEKYFVKESATGLMFGFEYDPSIITGIGSTQVVTGWQPTENEFSRKRQRDNFVKDVESEINKINIKVPFDIIYLETVDMGQYDFKKGEFPLVYGSGNYPLFTTIQKKYENRRLKDVSSLKFLSDLKERPASIPMSSGDAEIFLKNIPRKESRSIDKQTKAAVLLSTRVRVSNTLSVDGGSALEAEIVAFDLVDEVDPSNVVFSLASTDESTLASTTDRQEPVEWSVDDPKNLEADTFRLLFSRDHSSELPSKEDLRYLVAQRMLLENYYLDGKGHYHTDSYWGSLFDKNELARAQELGIAGGDIEKYKNWTEDRVKNIGNELLIPILAVGGKEGELVPVDLMRSLRGSLASLPVPEDRKNRVSAGSKSAFRKYAENVARKKYPDSPAVMSAFIGTDLLVGIALKPDQRWFEGKWVSGDANWVESGKTSNIRLGVKVSDSHAFITENGRNGLVLQLEPTRLFTVSDGQSSDFLPELSSGNSVSRTLDVMGISIGDDFQAVRARSEAVLGGAVTVSEIEKTKLALSTGYEIKLTETVEDAPTTRLHVYVDDGRVVAVGRQLEYGKADISGVQILNGLKGKYGDPSVEISSVPGKHGAIYTAWAETDANAARLRSTKYLKDDCIIDPNNQYWLKTRRNISEPGNGVISVKEISECGTYVVALIREKHAKIILVDSKHVSNRTKYLLEQERVLREEENQDTVEGIKF